MSPTPSLNCWCGGAATTDGLCLDSIWHDASATGKRDSHSRIYVAGPMSGYPENNYPAFHEAAERLRAAGYDVVSPAEVGAHGDDRVHYVDLIREDLRMMLDCHAVATLENWWESTGARNEVAVAGILKMPVRSVADWLERAHQELAVV